MTKLLNQDKFYSFVINEKSYEVVIANDCQTREKSYRLMYDIYSEMGYGKKHYSNMWFSLHEILPNTFTVIITHEEVAVATMTVALDSSLKIPADVIYEDILRQKRRLGHRIGEVFSLGIKKEERGNKLILGKLINFSYLISRHIKNLTHWAITVVPRHAIFYCKQMLFEHEEDIRYHEKTGVYCKFLYHSLNSFDDLNEEEWEQTFYRYYFPKAIEHKILSSLKKFVSPITSKEISYFLTKRPEILEDITKEEKTYLMCILQKAHSAKISGSLNGTVTVVN